ncbi:MAG: DUF1801 domain-containing protein [Novosphingobium sp.]|nr:DUF1801 domain-containing protein [Novosphingobium sp.]
MAKAENKTSATGADVAAFIASVAHEKRREDAYVLDALHRRVTGHEPRMWGSSIVGYGSYHYKYESGREGDSLRGGFSPRKAASTIYLMGNYCDSRNEADALFAKLGKYRTGKSCLYVTRLENVDIAVLEALVALSWQIMNEKYPD